MEFEKPRTRKNLNLSGQDTVSIAPNPKPLMSIKIKESQDNYSEDFEDLTNSVPQSSERSVKCFVCGEMIRVSEAGDHPKYCKKARNNLANVLSPRDESNEWKELTKSVTQSSIVEEVYDSDFEEESDR